MPVSVAYLFNEAEYLRGVLWEEQSTWFADQRVQEFNSLDRQFTYTIETANSIVFWTERVIYGIKTNAMNEHLFDVRTGQIKHHAYTLKNDLTRLLDLMADVAGKVRLTGDSQYGSTMSTLSRCKSRTEDMINAKVTL